MTVEGTKWFLEGVIITSGQTVGQIKLIYGPWHTWLVVMSSGGQHNLFFPTLLNRGGFTLKTGGTMNLYSETLQDMHCIVVVAILALHCGHACAFAVNFPNVHTYCKDIWFMLRSGLKALGFFQISLNMLLEYF